MLILVDGPAPTSKDASHRATVIIQRPADTRPMIGTLTWWPRVPEPRDTSRSQSRGAKAHVLVNGSHFNAEPEYVHLATPALQSAIADPQHFNNLRIVRQPEGASHA